ncbi:Hypothetical protein FKW44_009466 [Caligus rogercresseyi]|uniref:Uncharacterized protein n=1 Tax=Caligus rogercresseyi TaxID=217165 RepID=A0A7T8K6N9_CALRO|nr:Hypothetical protein FKW44_009466 [Caligus rogercresseyi]
MFQFPPNVAMRSSFSPCGTPVSSVVYPPPPHIRIHRESSLSSGWKRLKSGFLSRPRRLFIDPFNNMLQARRNQRRREPHHDFEEDKRGSGGGNGGLPLQLIRNDGRYHHIPQPSYNNGQREEDEIRPYDEEEDNEYSPPYQLAEPARSGVITSSNNAQLHHHYQPQLATDSDVSELKS